VPPPLILLLGFYVAGAAFARGGALPPIAPGSAFLMAIVLAVSALLVAWLGMISAQSASALNRPESPDLALSAWSNRRGLAFIVLGLATALFGFGRQVVLQTESLIVADFLSAAPSEQVWNCQATVSESPIVSADGSVRVVVGDVTLSMSPAESVASASMRLFALPGRVQLRVSAEAMPGDGKLVRMQPGARLTWRGPMRPPFSAKTPGVYDEARSLLARRIHAVATMRDSAGLRIQELEGVVFSRALPLHARQRALEALDAADLGEDARAALGAMCLGSSSELSPQLRQAYSVTGIGHILSISGLHTALLAALAFAAARLGGAGPRGAAWMTVLVLPFFVAMVGFQPAVTRSAVMTAIMLGPLLVGMAASPWARLGLAAWCIVLARHEALWHPGVHWSFAAVAGLMLLGQPIAAAIYPEPSPGDAARGRVRRRWIRAWLVAPIAAMLAVWITLLPLYIAYQGEVPMLGALGNALAVPASMVSVGIGFVAFLAAFFVGDAAVPLVVAAGYAVEFQNAIVRFFAWLPGASVRWGDSGILMAIAYYAVVLPGGPWGKKSRLPWSAARLRGETSVRFAAAVLMLALAAPGAGPRSSLGVAVLDVAQGDAIHLALPGGAHVLVDGGTAKPRDQGRWTVLPYLRQAGVDHLDVVVATHHDADHIGGLIKVLEGIPVDLLLEPPGEPNDPELRAAWKRARMRARRRVEARQGQVLRDGAGAALFILWPTGDPVVNAHLPANDRAIILWAKYGEGEALLMADIGHTAEAMLLEQGLVPQADLLKAGHHGSRNSGGEVFLRQVAPGVVLVSCGMRNPYGHPHPEAMKRYRRAAAVVATTADEGTMTVELGL